MQKNEIIAELRSILEAESPHDLYYGIEDLIEKLEGESDESN